MQWTPVPIPFTTGIDTRSDPKTVQPPKLTGLENGVFLKDHRISKRNGYTKLPQRLIGGSNTTLAASRALDAFANELLYWDDHYLNSWSPTSNAWRVRGGCESWVASTSTPMKVQGEQTAADRATVNGVTIYAWEDSRSGGVRYSIFDSSTNQFITHDVLVGLSSSVRPRVVAVGGVIHLYFFDTNAIKVMIFDPAAYTAGTGATPSVLLLLSATVPFYDVDALGSFAVVAYANTATTIGLTLIFSDGTVGAGPNGVAAGGNVSSISCCFDPILPQAAMAFTTDAATNSVKYFTINVPSGVGSGPTTVDAAGSTTWNACACAYTPGSGNPPNVWYEKNAAQTYNRIVYLNGSVFYRHSALASRAWRDGLFSYVHLVHDSPLQSTYFAVRSDKTIIARSLPGIAGGVPTRNTLPQMDALGNRTYAWAALYKTRLQVTRTTTSYPAVYTERGIKSLTYSCSDQQSHRTAQVGQAIYLSGGFLWQYDGLPIVESGFHLFPEFCTLTPAAGGSMTASSSYSYRIYFEWTNARGEREQSSLAAAFTVAMAAAQTQVTLVINTLAQTLKSATNVPTFARRDVDIAIYRTANNPTSDSPFYRVSSTNPTTAGSPNGWIWNDPTADTVSFVDQMADALLTTQEVDYQSTGEFDHIAPPAPSVMAAVQDRVFLAGFEDPNQVRFSLLHYDGAGLAFSDTMSRLETPDEGGAVTALAHLNGTLIIFKRNRIYYVSGDGPSNTGVGSFSAPQAVSADTGCSNQRSVVVTPMGVIFQSPKGIYLLTPSMGLEYIGADVDAYNSQTITNAQLLPDRYEVRFLCSSGVTLVYNYWVQGWSVFTNHTGVDGTLWQNMYAYATDSHVLVESPTAFADDGVPYRLAVESGWVRMEGLQILQRVKGALVLGEFRSTHTLRMRFGFDGATTYDDFHDVQPTAASAGYALGQDSVGAPAGTYQPLGFEKYLGRGDVLYEARGRTRRQKCRSVRVRIEDIPSANGGESCVLNELMLIIAPKVPSSAKVPAVKTA
jgi:hypothetical protein